eukprot:3853989-Rhodomonas_salina.2
MPAAQSRPPRCSTPHGRARSLLSGSRRRRCGACGVASRGVGAERARARLRASRAHAARPRSDAAPPAPTARVALSASGTVQHMPTVCLLRFLLLFLVLVFSTLFCPMLASPEHAASVSCRLRRRCLALLPICT